MNRTAIRWMGTGWVLASVCSVSNAVEVPIRLEFIDSPNQERCILSLSLSTASPAAQPGAICTFDLLATGRNDIFLYYDQTGVDDIVDDDRFFVVFRDPSNCFEQNRDTNGDYLPVLARPCIYTPPDELYYEVSDARPGARIPDRFAHLNGDAAERPLQPVVNTFFGPRQLGPATQGAKSNFGYGADDQFPGLVLLSDTGVGLVLDENFARLGVRTSRNLAGLLDFAALQSTGTNSEGGASALVRFRLMEDAIVPWAAADFAIGSPTGDPDYPNCYTATPLYSVDGQPPSGRIEKSLYRFVAFIVQGVAPNLLSDADGDGNLDARDAELAGYKVISNMTSLIFKLPASLPAVFTFPADLDQNGAATSFCPDDDSGDGGEGGPGKISRPD